MDLSGLCELDLDVPDGFFDFSDTETDTTQPAPVPPVPATETGSATNPRAHFSELSTDKLHDYSKRFVPVSTRDTTKWAVTNFNDWVKYCNSSECDEDHIPPDILLTATATDLNRVLSLYVMETHNTMGSKYPNKTINLLLAGLRRYMASNDPRAINFLDEKNPEFAGLRGVRDRVSREMWNAGIGVTENHTEGISFKEEQLLWSKGMLGFDSPNILLNTIFFYNGKVLILRGGREHRELKLSQFYFGNENGKAYVQFAETGSKNRSGSYKGKTCNKVIRHYADLSLGNKCYHYILSFYFQKIPQEYPGNAFYFLFCYPRRTH